MVGGTADEVREDLQMDVGEDGCAAASRGVQRMLTTTML
jgi:hypothetical protein